ncbi:MAG: helix-turn-helix domain-containing protein [Candidatus Bathyarchaeia archaeon]|jgi:sugar-specific transcriptional regulator TrmB
MELQDRSAQTLHKLGLTPLQAKMYLTLINMKKEKIQTIARAIGADRSNTYQVIDQLQKMGLVERLVDTPNFFQAIPLHEGISTLMERKKNEYNELRNEAEQLITANKVNSQTSEEKEHEFKIMSKGKTSQTKDIIKHCQIAQTNLDMLLSIKDFHYGINALSKYYFECVKRGVKCRTIIQEPSFASIKKNVKRFAKVPGFQIKYVLSSPKVVFVIVDKKDLHTNLFPNRTPVETTELILDHPGIIEVFQNYFETVWKQAQELK